MFIFSIPLSIADASAIFILFFSYFRYSPSAEVRVHNSLWISWTNFSLFFRWLLLTNGEFKLKLHRNDVKILDSILFSVPSFILSLIICVFTWWSFMRLCCESHFYRRNQLLVAILKRWERYFDRPQNENKWTRVPSHSEEKEKKKRNFSFLSCCKIREKKKRWKWESG